MPPKSIPSPPTTAQVAQLQRRLLAWYQRAGRDLPWRRTRDPYKVLVSEVMLQQTQVSRVAEYYPRFLARFPDLETLAGARARAVREEWDGLGYYARATNLHRLAKGVAKKGATRKGVPRDSVPALPSDPAELIKLPGVGRYTAGAIACFAYEQPVPAVDTNVARVISRVFVGERLTQQRRTLQRSSGQRVIWELATALVPKTGKRAWKFNQAIMELGALICTARTPRCGACPVQNGCRTVQLSSPTTQRRREQRRQP